QPCKCFKCARPEARDRYCPQHWLQFKLGRRLAYNMAERIGVAYLTDRQIDAIIAKDSHDWMAILQASRAAYREQDRQTPIPDNRVDEECWGTRRYGALRSERERLPTLEELRDPRTAI